MQLRRITPQDWPWIQHWFEDERLNEELGPLDEAWLDHVLHATDGVQLVGVEDGAPAALVGCVWSPEPGGLHGITDIAVRPAVRGTGLGRRALAAVVGWDGHPPAAGWMAFVDHENDAAHAFFTALAWTYRGLDDEMHRFELMAP
ncbi:GNAT family N-acetyltransferase [Shinella sp. JR1-6]|jgi:GNAT superfamily N-acetyltransferase|uniref:GNAT family N-acetyltransferase n=1 Tax=Shinella sp. JR1-6 TaxID=2527671 RepID=UPI00102D4673|nr:GNAT family N-acetyltransferase [Shinella sp. JR1-6]TAA60078.1 GNAT family N-acetyltransferase [Shinella sp. JR1-6]